MGGVAKAVEKVVTGVGKAAEALVKNPLPVIETIAITAALGPEGLALGLNSAQAGALSSAAVSAANGGNLDQIAKAAASGAVGGAVGEQASLSATAAGASKSVAKIAASAAGADAATTVSAFASGQPLDKALEAGLKSGVLAAGTTGVLEAGKSALSGPPTGAAMKGVGSTVPPEQVAGDYSVKADYSLPSQTAVSGTGLTDKIPASMESMGGATGLKVDSNIILPPSLANSPYAPPSTGKVAGTDAGGLQPAYKSAADILTPSSFDTSLTADIGYKEPTTISATSEPVLPKGVEAGIDAARPLVSGALSEVFGLGPKIPGTSSSGVGAPIAQGTATGTSVGLTGERGAGEIEGKETGKPRKNVWNEASLRLKDALGV